MAEQTYDMDPNSDGDAPRWIVRQDGDVAPEDSWATVVADIGDPATRGETSFLDEMPEPRRASVVVGGMQELHNLIRASDRIRARLLKRDLRWINGIVEAAGMELVLVRDAVEDD